MTQTGMDRGGVGQSQGVNRVLAKLDKSIETGNYYEALQMYRTLNFRYAAQKKFAECLDLLYNGSLKLVAKQQETSAADLGLLLVETLEKRGACEDGALWIDRLGTIISRLNATTVERETLIARAVKWSGDMSNQPHGHPALHMLIGHVFMEEGNTELARHHYLLCRNGDLCGRILVKINCNRGYVEEVDLFIVQAVLQLLCLKNRDTAEHTFNTYTKLHPHIERKSPPFNMPLLNFIHFLFRSIDLKNLEAFRKLCDMYKPSLERDPAFGKYLVKISVLYLNAQPPNSSGIGSGGLMGGMFGDLFTRLFQGFEDDDDESDEHDHHQQQRAHLLDGNSGNQELD